MKPFDLEAAKRGDPVVTGKGDSVKFIAHVPEAQAPYRVVAYILGSSHSTDYYEDGKFAQNPTSSDLFMAPKKKIVWVNLYVESFRPRESISCGYAYETEMLANANSEHTRIGGKAWPMEIEE
ncbi:hypothetical protein D3C87_324400 [compost metagenome]